MPTFTVSMPCSVEMPVDSTCAAGIPVAGLPGFARLDSLAIAGFGNICVATLDGGSIAEITTDGTHVRHRPVPDLGVTNACFGRPDLRTACDTLSHEGRLGAMGWHEPGLRL